jgi:hypothetical protein
MLCGLYRCTNTEQWAKMCFHISPPGGKRWRWIEILRVLCTFVDEYRTHEKVSTWSVERSRMRYHIWTDQLTDGRTDGPANWRRTVKQYLPTFSESGEIMTTVLLLVCSRSILVKFVVILYFSPRANNALLQPWEIYLILSIWIIIKPISPLWICSDANIHILSWVMQLLFFRP